MKHEEIRKLNLAAIFSALIIVMTFIPQTGYITANVIEITTLHIVVILGSSFLGWAYGGILGGVWGVTCLIRAFTNPLFVLFTNPLISVLPRIIVGIVAGLVFMLLSKTKLNKIISAAIAALAATLTNTVLVLGAIYAFQDMFKSYAGFIALFKDVYMTIIGLNGSIELIAAVILVPTFYKVLEKVWKKQ